MEEGRRERIRKKVGGRCVKACERPPGESVESSGPGESREGKGSPLKRAMQCSARK
jgi:hypothetical protein